MESILEDALSKYPTVRYFSDFQRKMEAFFGIGEKTTEDNEDRTQDGNKDHQNDQHDEDGSNNNSRKVNTLPFLIIDILMY